MSARDIDLEFEKAYKRLFATSASTEAVPNARSPASLTLLAGSSKISHTAANTSRSAGPSTSRSDEPQHSARDDARLQSLSRQPSGNKTLQEAKERRSGQAQPAQRKRPHQSRSPRAGLEALARHGALSNAKGKARAYPHLETEAHGVDRLVRSPSIPVIGLPSSSDAPHAGHIAYYPYTHPPTPYRLSGPIVGPSLTSLPGQAVAWTQPIMSAGPMSAVAYPGFSASVTFSQPQFFASHPQQMQPALTALPTEPWPQQYIPQPVAQSDPHSQPAQPNLDTTLTSSREPQPASTSAQPPPDPVRIPRKDTARLKVEKPNMETPRKKTSWKPLLDENGNRIPRKIGRPPLRELTSEGVTHGIERPRAVARAAPSVAFDMCVPLSEDACQPSGRETHTLFIHSSRQLRWLAHCAIRKASREAEDGQETTPSVLDSRQWARWSHLFSAQPSLVRDQPSPPCPPMPKQEPITPTPLSSPNKSDPAGLFPRDKRRRYMRLLRNQHTSPRFASPRICISRLLRYLAKTNVVASSIQPRNKAAFVERKHRPEKLARHLFRSTRPSSLDVHALWKVWARTSHANKHVVRTRVSFALGDSDGGSGVKIEPESSPRVRLSQIKPEPEPESEPHADSGMNPFPEMDTGRTTEAEAEVGREKQRRAVFLRRNFHIYRSIGLTELPLL